MGAEGKTYHFPREFVAASEPLGSIFLGFGERPKMQPPEHVHVSSYKSLFDRPKAEVGREEGSQHAVNDPAVRAEQKPCGLGAHGPPGIGSKLGSPGSGPSSEMSDVDVQWARRMGDFDEG